MEIFLIDYIVNNVTKTRKTIKTQLNLFNKLFGSAYEFVDEQKIKDRKYQIEKYKQKLEFLLNIPKIEQRSDEWYTIRKELITASDFALALGKGKFGTRSQFYRNKCGYENNNLDTSIPAIQWGVKYEEVAAKFYKIKMNVELYEFGILKHPSINYIGASPDGISDMGIMLEIKCPWKRKKTETIPEQYYYQIQGQLEVCDLEECDYLECYIIEYGSYDEMLNDNSINYKGIIFKNDDATYIYPNINDFTYNNEQNVTFYGIKDYFMKRVYRDKMFFADILPSISQVWSNVVTYRTDENMYNKDIKKQKKDPKFLFRNDVQE